MFFPRKKNCPLPDSARGEIKPEYFKLNFFSFLNNSALKLEKVRVFFFFFFLRDIVDGCVIRL